MGDSHEAAGVGSEEELVASRAEVGTEAVGNRETRGRGGGGEGAEADEEEAQGCGEGVVLPLRKRLLASQKHRRLPSPGFMSDFWLSALSQPELKGVLQASGTCVTCGGGGDGRLLHRLKHQGVSQHHCSSCILFHNRGVYCSLCFQVYGDSFELGDTASWLSCYKCSRASHVECVRSHGPSSLSSDSSSFTCLDCSLAHQDAGIISSKALTKGNSSVQCEGASQLPSDEPPDGLEPLNKKMRTSLGVQEKYLGPDLSDSNPGHVAGLRLKNIGADFKQIYSSVAFFDQESVAAAKVVAALATKEATDAKARAIAAASASVKAATRAKAALDDAYHAGKEEARYRVDSVRQSPVTKVVSPLHFSVPNTVERRVGRGDHTGQLGGTPVTKEEGAGHSQKLMNVSPRSPRNATASYKRRTLSAIVASEASRAMSNSGQGLQNSAVSSRKQQFVPTKQLRRVQLASIEHSRGESLTSIHPVAEMCQEERQKHVASLAASEGLFTGALQTAVPGPSDPPSHGKAFVTVQEVSEQSHEGLKQQVLSLASSEGLLAGAVQINISSPSKAAPLPTPHEDVEQSYEALGQQMTSLGGSQRLLADSLQCKISDLKGASQIGTLSPVHAFTEQSGVQQLAITLAGSDGLSLGISQAILSDSEGLLADVSVTEGPHISPRVLKSESCSSVLAGISVVAPSARKMAGNGTREFSQGLLAANGFCSPPSILPNAASTSENDVVSCLVTTSDHTDKKDMNGKSQDRNRAGAVDQGQIEIFLPGLEAMDGMPLAYSPPGEKNFDGQVILGNGHHVSSSCLGRNSLENSGGEIARIGRNEVGFQTVEEAGSLKRTEGRNELRSIAGTEMASSASKQKTERLGVVHSLSSSCADHKDHNNKPMLLNLTNSPVGVACSAPLPTPALTGIPAGRHC